jgi:AbrB family looped-hinge helix DNA binding protein
MGRHTGLKATIAERGQITIPKSLRVKLGLTAGTVVNFELVNGQVVLRKEGAAQRVKNLTGTWQKKFRWKSTDDYINEIRGPVA